LQRLIGRWRQIVVVTLFVSSFAIVLIFQLVKPTYEALSTLRIEPSTPEICGAIKSSMAAGPDISPYMETQVNVITSDRVLSEAVSNPLVNKLPIITMSKDPKADLREQLAVDIVEGACMIRVALESSDANQAAMIVNAVVETYMRQNTEFNRSANITLQKSMENTLEELVQEIRQKRADLKRALPVLNPETLKNDPDHARSFQPVFSTITDKERAELVDKLLKSDFEHFDALAELKAVQAVRARNKVAGKDTSHAGLLSDEKLRALEVAVE
jgi:capsular polysaccharide biosynthesis protein